MFFGTLLDPFALARALRGEAARKPNGHDTGSILSASPRAPVFPQALARWHAEAPMRAERERQEELARRRQTQPPESPQLNDHPVADVQAPAETASDPAPAADDTDPTNPWG